MNQKSNIILIEVNRPVQCCLLLYCAILKKINVNRDENGYSSRTEANVSHWTN